MAAARQPGDALVEGCGSLLTCEHGGLDAKTAATGAAKNRAAPQGRRARNGHATRSSAATVTKRQAN
jgi:hypothetical protein